MNEIDYLIYSNRKLLRNFVYYFRIFKYVDSFKIKKIT